MVREMEIEEDGDDSVRKEWREDKIKEKERDKEKRERR